jgi:hypothetical protein
MNKINTIINEDYNTDEIYVACEQKRKNCFAYRKDGTCDCLIDTHFNKQCPFYKTKAEIDKKRAEEIKRIRENPSKPF